MLKSKSPGVKNCNRCYSRRYITERYQKTQETTQNIRTNIKEEYTMRILIYGAGVIESFYASRFAKAGLDVTVLARGQQLKELQGHGLWYRGKTRTHKVEVKTISELKPNDRYQFIFLTVREKSSRRSTGRYQ